MIKAEDILIMERSLGGDLNPEEMKDFQNRLKTDSEFAKHYEIMRDLPMAINVDVGGYSADLKSVMGNGKVADFPRRGQPSMGRMILAVAAVAIGIAIIASLFDMRTTPDLFAQNYSTPPENMTIRDDSDLDPDLQKALEAYNQENFELAAKSFSNYLHFNPEDQSAQFYLGISLLSIEDYVKAIAYFTLLEKEANPFQNSSLWYHGLAELKLGEIDKAKNLFQKLANTPGQNYQLKSQSILDQLNK